jgi:hypothetical protein
VIISIILEGNGIWHIIDKVSKYNIVRLGERSSFRRFIDFDNNIG